MKTVHKFSLQHSRFMLGGLLLSIGLLAFLSWLKTPAVLVKDALHGATALEQLKKDGSYPSLAAAMNAARYQVQTEGQAWRAENPAQQLSAHFTTSQVRIAEAAAAQPHWQFGLKLSGYGYGDEVAPVSEGTVSAQGDRVEIRKGPITEWYVNKPEGLEQGFTLNAPPQSASRNPQSAIKLTLQLSGDLQAASTNHQAVTLNDNQGRTVLSYDHLTAWDANHQTLSATMSANGKTITLEVNDTNAVYPVTVDPTFTQFNKLIAGDGAVSDHLGSAVALSGDTVAVAAPGDDAPLADQGSVYVFVRSGSAWTQQAKLTANDGAANDHFGNSVAIDGNTVIVGAQEAKVDGGDKVGAAYVFVRSGATWTQQAKISPGFLVNSFTRFGKAVALNGDTAVIGAFQENVNNIADTGAVYIYTRSGTTWTRQQKLTTSDAAQFDQFGSAVAISGETVLAGAFTAGNKGAAYVFTRSGSSWSQQSKLLASDGSAFDFFGQAVALNGDTAVIGAQGADVNGNQSQGAAYVFARTGTNWSQQIKLTANDGSSDEVFGAGVVISGENIAVGAPLVDVSGNADQGAVYVYTLTGANWTLRQKFTTNNHSLGANLGSALAMSEGLLIAGAPYDTISGNAGQGASYIFQISRRYPQTDILLASDGTAGDHFGISVAINGTVAAIGAPDEDINGQTNQGAVYVFTRSGPAAITWTFQQKLTNGTGGDRFGTTIALGSGAMVIGAPTDDVFGSVDQGSAYAYTFSANAWNFQQQLFAADPAAGDRFGAAVSISGSTAVVGSPYATISGKADQGAAYVFTQSGNVWTQQQKLIANDGAAIDFFGTDVSVDANTVVVGANRHNVGGNAGQGAAYVFFRSGNTWSQQAQLTANDGALDDYLGSAVALSGDTALIGAHGDDPSGAAYVFTRTGATWSQQAKLKASDDSNIFSRFGGAVALNGNTAVVGAPLAKITGESNQGAAYVYTRSGSTWTQQQRLLASNGLQGDELGNAIAIDPGTKGVLIGAPYHNSGQGTAYFFADPLALSIVPGTLPSGTVGLSYNQTLNPSVGTLPYAFFLVSGALPPGLSIAFNGQAAATLSGTPTKTGPFNFTLGVNDANGFYGTQSYALMINCANLSISPATAPGATAAQPYNLQLNAPGSVAPFTFTLFGSLPTGLTLNPTTGLIAGTPTVSGSFNFQVGLLDANGCEALRAYTLNIGCATITVNPATLPGGTVGIGGYNQPLSASGGIAPYTFSVNPGDTLPPGLSLVNGAIVGGPQQGGTFLFTIKATDANGCIGSRGYSFTATCQTLNVFPATLPTLTVGAPFSQGLSASGSDGPFTYNVAGGAVPDGITLSTGGLLSGTPTVSGSGSFTVNVADVYGCATPKQYNFTVACGPLNITPTSLPNGATGVAYSQQLSTTGGSGNYTYSLPLGLLPPPGLNLSPSGLLSGTPTQAGQFNLTVNVASGGCTGQQSYTLTITQSCGTMTITPATLPNGAVGVAYNQQLTASGGTGNLAYAVTSGALSADLTLTPSGLLSGTPTQSAVINFTVTATDANGCTGQKSYVLTVTCPTITIGPATLPNGTTGTAYNQQLTQSGGVGTVTFGMSVGSLPAGLHLSNSGLISGTPTQAGAGNFTVTATDANGCLGTKQYSLTINAGCPTINLGPNPPSPAFVGTPYSHTFNATGGSAPYTFSLAQEPIPDGLTLSTAGVLSGTPTGNNGGGFAFTVKATDANGCMGQVQFGLTIASCPTITVNPATLPNGQAGTSYSQQLSASGGSAPYAFALASGSSLPNGLTLSGTGLLSGTPTVFGSFNFTVKATATGGCPGTRAYTLTITAPCAAITVNPASLPNGTVGTAYNQTVTATGGTGPYSFTVSAGALPGGLALNTGGALTGTPNAAGLFDFTVKATDANGCFGTRAYSVTINSNVVNNGLQFYPLPRPLRLLDTRPGQVGCDAPGAQIPGGTSRNQLARRTCEGITIPANARAITGNVTTVESGGGYLTLYPSDATQPLVASSNYAPNEIINNVFTVGLGNADGSFKIFATSDTHVVVDVTGYYAPPTAGGLYFHPLPKPIRLLETRAGFNGAFTPGQSLLANTDTLQAGLVTYDGVTIPATALALVGNATVVNNGAGYLTLYPAGVPRPLAASSNFSAGQIMNAPFTVGLSAAGQFNIYTIASTDLVIDVLGYYSADATDANGVGLLFNPLAAPVRLLETRAGLTGCYTPGAPLLAGSIRNQPARGVCGGQTVAANALAIVGNATVVNDQAGYLTFWPNGAAQPLVATSNFNTSQVINRHFTVGLGVTGMFNIFTPSQTDLVVDVAGFFAP